METGEIRLGHPKKILSKEGENELSMRYSKGSFGLKEKKLKDEANMDEMRVCSLASGNPRDQEEACPITTEYEKRENFFVGCWKLRNHQGYN